MYKLFGDGIHDDTLAIQQLIDSGKCEVVLPAPDVCYLISKPLELPSNFSLVLPRFAHIKLMPNSNCVMLKNKTEYAYSKRCSDPAWYYCNEYADDCVCKNIEVRGGIWDFNNKEQEPSPLATGNFSIKEYSGFGMLFYNVSGLTVCSLTVKDPANFAMVLDKVSYFTVRDICFDFNDGNPDCGNMDGVHLCGNCHFGTIENIKGATYDDMVALNADEGSDGEISNITINGLYAEDCHSAVRLLASKTTVKNIHISNVFGTYYQYCVGLTKFYESDTKGIYDAVTIDNVYASKAERYCHGQRTNPDGVKWSAFAPKKYADTEQRFEDSWNFALIFIDANLNIKGLKISNLHRREENVPIDTIFIDKNTTVEQLILENITTENHTKKYMPLFTNNGNVSNFKAYGIYEDGNQTNLKA
ncbi:MAG: hypothetical protein IJN65_02850 [Clostridia bacterium]|nr:hypothetical protein [Clostridia bacterium]